MDLEVNRSYHIYNQGNNQHPIFFETENYLFFLRKMRKHVLPYSRVIAYCLMPNHFHWYLQVKNRTGTKSSKTADKLLVGNIGTLLSSYAQAVNRRYERSGSLFRKKTKSVKIDSQEYGLTCFHYIHQNPIKATLVAQMGEWPFSSYPDYAGLRKGTLVSKKFTFDYLDIDPDSFLEESKQALDSDKLKHIF